MNAPSATVVVGDGWLGRAVASAVPGCIHTAQRAFDRSLVPPGAAMIVASGWSSLPSDQRDERVTSELRDVELLLDVARERDARIVVIGSSDVCGLAEVVDGSTPVDPVSAYGELKARREELVVEARRGGLDAVAVRLGPTHGPGKAQTARMLALAAKPVIGLPRGGRYSVGFVTLVDAVSAFVELAAVGGEPVVSVGGGPTELRSLVVGLGDRLGRRARIVHVPMPAPVAHRLARSDVGRLAWLGRFSLPRAVAMETSVTPMPIEQASHYLVDQAEPPA